MYIMYTNASNSTFFLQSHYFVHALGVVLEQFTQCYLWNFHAQVFEVTIKFVCIILKHEG